MNNPIEIQNLISEKKYIFPMRLDYYWKSLSIYAIVLSLFIFIKESISNNKIINSIYQPIIMLLVLFVSITTAVLLYQMYKKKTLIITSDSMTISFRKKSKSYPWSKISKISFVNDKFKRNNAIRLVKIKISKYRILRLNPSNFENDSELIGILSQIKNFISTTK